ncbi:putative alpha-l-fucosidase 2 protein [Rosellinia necatrix]|uniref:Putative alpha-l-fucosidase 2 protein n=1 Tax=Rosellinia necatrix TaxID=77044 RepID=A0A1W2TID6_ROSNE|nr:putative alpha-l-fucosidase 2 protein [Rosellinia necatrix]
MRLTGRHLVAFFLAFTHHATAASEASHLLWYSEPAQRDFFDALPIGNGFLGAMIHGYTDRELIRLNEESIWSGGPMDKIPPNAKGALKGLRQQILDGQLTEAGENWMTNFKPEHDDMRRYQPAGELRIDFPHPLGDISDYRRSLDLTSAISSLTYTFNGTEYRREAFGNFPRNVLAFKFLASEAGALSFNISLTRDRVVTELAANATTATLLLSGSGEEDDTYRFVSKARVVLKDRVGTISSNDTSLAIQGASEAWVLYAVETAYRHTNATTEQLHAVVDQRISSSLSPGYESLRAESIRDYQQYFNRTHLDLGDSGAIGRQNVTKRLADWKSSSNNATNLLDLELVALQFNYGRYLLTQSSRPGTLPANLQGVWNRDFGPPWDSKFTLNVNLEMNYWPAQPLDLREVAASPVMDLLDRLAVTGASVAAGMYGARGWCCHHNTDVTGDCTPYHHLTIAAPYPLGGAWLSFEAIEHFRFTGDLAFARERTLPVLRGVLDFVYDWATQDGDGRWITNPSCSPENSYVIPEGMSVAGDTTGLDAGAMNDRAIMWEVTTGFLEISAALNITGEEVDRAAAFRDNILGPVVGPSGRLLEYSREFEENDPGHRHFSPLVGAHPGSWISPLTTPAHADAAYALLRHRMDSGGGGNSWAVAWASLLHARLLDAPHALEYAMQFLSRWVHNNLFSRNGGYFQIDGNSGFTACIIEMFLQSHAGVVHLGPAIPPGNMGLSSGSFTGWIARGGFKVDMTWQDGAVVEASIKSLLGSPLKLRVGDGMDFEVRGGVVQPNGAILTDVGQTIQISLP